MPWYAWLILLVAIGSVVGGLMMLRDTAKKLPSLKNSSSASMSATQKWMPRTPTTVECLWVAGAKPAPCYLPGISALTASTFKHLDVKRLENLRQLPICTQPLQ